MVQHGGDKHKVAILVDVQSCRNVSLFLLGLCNDSCMACMQTLTHTWVHMCVHVLGPHKIL